MRFLSGSRGLAAVVLPVVIAFALGAVLMLTGTLLAAREIDERVEIIVNRTTDIDRDLEAVRLARRTSRISDRILVQVKPLDRQLGVVVDTAESIDTTASSILVTARSINDRVVSINASVESILATARSIEVTVASINQEVDSIDATAESILATVLSIESTVDSIEGEATSIDATVASIRATLAAVLGEARSIDPGVARINLNAEQVIRRVSPIMQDTEAIVDQVGRGNVPGERVHTDSIHGHANSIDCSPVIDPPTDERDGVTEYCDR